MGYLLTCFSFGKVSHSVVNGLFCPNKSAKTAKNRDFGGKPPVGSFLAHLGQKCRFLVKNWGKKVKKTFSVSEKHFTMFL